MIINAGSVICVNTILNADRLESRHFPSIDGCFIHLHVNTRFRHIIGFTYQTARSLVNTRSSAAISACSVLRKRFRCNSLSQFCWTWVTSQQTPTCSPPHCDPVQKRWSSELSRLLASYTTEIIVHKLDHV